MYIKYQASIAEEWRVLVSGSILRDQYNHPQVSEKDELDYLNETWC